MSSTRPAARSGSSTPPPGNGADGDHRSLVLGPRDRLVGQLYVEGDLRVIGTVEGALEVMGSVEIDEGGKVTGPVTARDRLVVGRAGSLKGDVRVARLVVQDGATFSGNVSMGKFVGAPPKPVEVVEPAKEPEPVKLEEAIPAPQAAQPAEVFKPQQPARPPQPARSPQPATPPQLVKQSQPIKQSQPVKPPQPVRPHQPTKPPQTKGKRR